MTYIQDRWVVPFVILCVWGLVAVGVYCWWKWRQAELDAMHWRGEHLEACELLAARIIEIEGLEGLVRKISDDREKVAVIAEAWEAKARWLPNRRELISLIMSGRVGNSAVRIALSTMFAFRPGIPTKPIATSHTVELTVRRFGFMRNPGPMQCPVEGLALICPWTTEVLAVGFPGDPRDGVGANANLTTFANHMMPPGLTAEGLNLWFDELLAGRTD